MPLALLLSPDDQAVSAITAVLEEMSVTCERPLDGASAAQKLNSNRFDLVLVDCENLSAAKLIFDVCRHRQGSSHPVPVAVVDGRAGLPTAFRLGAELILTKPVSKDQARITIRTAISRVKKEEASHGGAVAPLSSYPVIASNEAKGQQSGEPQGDDAADYVAAEGRSFAAAAVASPARSPEPVPAASATTAPMAMKAAVVEPEPEVTTNSEPAKATKPTTAAPHPASSLFASSTPPAAEIETKPADKAPTVESKSESKGAQATSKGVLSLNLLADDNKLTAREETSEKKNEGKPQRKSRAGLITLLLLLVACGGFYAAWMYEPGFQPLVKSQINQLLVRFGLAPLPQQPTPSPARPASQMPKPSAGVPVQTVAPGAMQPVASDPNAAPGTASAPAAGAAQAAPATQTQPVDAPTSISGAQPTSGAPVSPAAAPSTTNNAAAPPVTPGTRPGVTRIDLSPADVAQAAKHAPSSSSQKQPPKH